MKKFKSKGFKTEQTQVVKQSQAERWFIQMLKSLPPKSKPDMGHRYYQEGVINPEIILSGWCNLLFDQMDIQISTVSESECVSILMSKSDALDLFSSDSMPTRDTAIRYDFGEACCIIECRLMPSLRYQARNGEFVLPLIGTPRRKSNSAILFEQ